MRRRCLDSLKKIREKKLRHESVPEFLISGGGKEIRTPDLFIANEPLYQLSYTPT